MSYRLEESKYRRCAYMHVCTQQPSGPRDSGHDLVMVISHIYIYTRLWSRWLGVSCVAVDTPLRSLKADRVCPDLAVSGDHGQESCVEMPGLRGDHGGIGRRVVRSSHADLEEGDAGEQSSEEVSHFEWMGGILMTGRGKRLRTRKSLMKERR